jgi:hypothetical protein
MRRSVAERQLFDVAQVGVHVVVHRFVVGALGDLPQPREAGLDRVPGVLPRLVGGDDLDELRTRTDETQLAAQHVDQLGELVEAQRTQRAPEPRVPRVVDVLCVRRRPRGSADPPPLGRAPFARSAVRAGDGDLLDAPVAGPAVGAATVRTIASDAVTASVAVHGPELEHPHDGAIQPDAVLAVDDPGAEGQPDGQRDQRHRDGEHQEQHRGQNTVDDRLDGPFVREAGRT